ncbi:MAG: site-specific DNA-methyltransferase [Chloroflexi bacterium]|nr:site-specific DNA-methyltransferase [Chloroflexota bacterium]
MDAKIICGDALEILKTLPDQFCRTCVTSPPYYGLRDYGTATWIGGNDPNCNHKLPQCELDPKRTGGDSGSSHVARFNKYNCHQCGAKRIDRQIGLEETPQEHIQRLIAVFAEVKRVLTDDGTLWINYGDTYLQQQGKGWNGQEKRLNEANRAIKVKSPLPPKNLLGMPWRLAFALQSNGWILRQEIIWAKGNPMPESVKDRCTKSHEHIFLLAKKPKYYFDHQAIKEPCSSSNIADFIRRKTLNNKGKGNGTYEEVRPDLCRSRQDYMPSNFMRNKRSVWHVNSKGFKEAHFATFPKALITPCILAGSAKGDTVLDPFCGSGTSGVVAKQYGRNFIGIDLNSDYCAMAQKRIEQTPCQYGMEAI